MEKDEHGNPIRPTCRLQPETPEEKLALAIYGFCIDCVPEEKLIQVNQKFNKMLQ